jgi:cobalt-zinc-cadmium resistance protein CzcA
MSGVPQRVSACQVGSILAIATLFLLLGNARAAIIATLVHLAVVHEWPRPVPANLMSLGALDFGLIIDGAIIIVENTLRRIAEQQGGTWKAGSSR